MNIYTRGDSCEILLTVKARIRSAMRVGRSAIRAVIALIEYMLVGRRCSFLLMDTPEHGNLGDQAIALAEQNLLARWFGPGSLFELTADQVNGWEGLLARFCPADQVILIHGGGFLGTLWPDEEDRFRRIIKAFSGRRIVVFPQTVTFDCSTDEGIAALEESVRIYAKHPNLTICCRELRSADFVRRLFPNVRIELAPDVVLGLDTPVQKAERRYVLFCMRADKEREFESSEIAKIISAVAEAYPRYPVRHTDTVVPRRVPKSRRALEVEAKLSEFAGARLVVTDRLHGMIFAALTGTPCVALNNSNGKVEMVYKWISDLPYIAFAKSIEEAIVAVPRMDMEPSSYPVREYQERLMSIYRLLADEYRSNPSCS